MRQFPFGTSEIPETPKSLLRSGREDISNQKSFMIRMVPDLKHTKTIHCQTSIKDLQLQNEVDSSTDRKQPCGPIFTEQKTGIIWSPCSWDDQNGLEVGSKKRTSLLSVSNQNSNHQFNSILFHKAKEKNGSLLP